MGKPYPDNEEPGFIYMLCGASQHSNTDALDKTVDKETLHTSPHAEFLYKLPQTAINTLSIVALNI